MRKYHFLVFILFLNAKLFSQSYEIGVSVLSYTSANQNSFQRDTLDYVRQKSRIAQPVLTLNFITKTTLDFGLQVGYFHTSISITQKSPVPVDYIVNQKATRLQKSVFIKAIVAKRFQKERLILISGINIPFEYCYYQRENFYSSTFFKDTIQSKRETYTKYAPEYNTGINLQQSAYYQLTKHIYLGIDLNLGLRINIINGSRIDQSAREDFKSPQNNYQNEHKANFHSVTKSLYFQPSISIKYNFRKKNEK